MLYHRNIKWNSTFNRQCMDILKYSYFEDSHHFECNKHEVNTKSVMAILRRLRAKEQKGRFFEVEAVHEHVTKVALRTSYDKKHDVTIVLSEQGKIITAWLNKKGDNHTTLNTSKYFH